MHIPENYLSPQTCAVMGAIMVPVWYRAVKKVDVQIKLKKDTGTMLGISSSLSFLIMILICQYLVEQLRTLLGLFSSHY